MSFINEMNRWKDGRAADARVEVLDDGTVVRGLLWRGEVSADVFETASVNAAQAFQSWADSRKGARGGKAAGFPRFKSRHRTTPAFRLRARSKEGAAPFRFARGRWTVTITGVAAQLHHQRRNPTCPGRAQSRVGVDLGVKTLAVAADEHGTQLHAGRG